MVEKLVVWKEKAIEKSLSSLEEEMKKEDMDPSAVEVLLKIVQGQYQSYFDAHEKLLAGLLEKNDEQGFLAQEEKHVNIQMLCETAQRNAGRLVTKFNSAVNDWDTHLPIRQLQQFTGEIQDWLRFWASFGEVDGNARFSDTKKFDYLLHCLPEGSKARKAIGGIPFMGKNYKTAITTLKNTFGRETTLVKYYMRELLQLASKKKDTMSLMDLVPLLTAQVRNLEELGVKSEKYEMVLYPVVECCIPEEVLKDWQKSADYEEKIEPILKYLNHEVQMSLDRSLAKMDFGSSSEDKKRRFEKFQNIPTASSLMVVDGRNKNGKTCVFCGSSRHKSQKCVKASERMSWEEKQEVIRKLKLCFRCLKDGHISNQCSSNVTCDKCKGKHFAVMCRSFDPNNQRTTMLGANPAVDYSSHGNSYPVFNQPSFYPAAYQNNGNFSVQQSTNPVAQVPVGQLSQKVSGVAATNVETRSSFSNLNVGSTTLMTMLVKVESADGLQTARVFIDPGSEESYVLKSTTENVIKQLIGEQVLAHQVFGGSVTQPEIHKKFKIKMFNLNGQFRGGFVFNEVNKIANFIRKPPVGNWMQVLDKNGIKLHDQSGVTDDVQFLFGADIAAKIWTGGFLRITDELVANETMFGWVLQGVAPSSIFQPGLCSLTLTSFLINQVTPEDLWSLQSIGILDEAKTKTKAEVELATVMFFKNTVCRSDEGRYQVKLPWTEGHMEIASNRNQAFARLQSVTRALQSDGFLKEYHSIFQTWLQDEIIENVPAGEMNTVDYFLPHHHVIKLGSTTPVRPVFDASAKARGGFSLNDSLEKGPNWLERIPAIITRFRCRKYGAVADIKKAFLQMKVDPDDVKWLQFLWWKDMDCKEVQVYRHLRVVFGVKSSPFLLAATLDLHIESESKNYPDIAEDLRRSFYVDNSVSCHDTMELAKRFQDGATEMLAKAEMNIRGWEFGPVEEKKIVSVLGLNWNIKTDELSLNLDNMDKKLNGPATKREILTAMNAIYDPLGLATPFTIICKMLFQKTCIKKSRWDENLEPEIADCFKKWKAQVAELKKLTFTRWIKKEDDGFSLHIFSDASAAAFSACVFSRSVNKEGEVSTHLLMCRSRLAPLNQKLSIPRLELLGCLVGVRLARDVRKYLLDESIPCTFHTDSTVALAWISRKKPWATFVMNRVVEIRSLSKTEDWHHIPGEHNPADLPSRGCRVEKLIKSKWWEGPEWMKSEVEAWPKSELIFAEDEIRLEEKKTVISAVTINKKEAFQYIEKYRDHHKRLRVMAFVVRYINRLKERINKKEKIPLVLPLNEAGNDRKGHLPLSLEEVEKAEAAIVYFIQTTSEEIKILDKKSLSKFVDSNGLIRVKSPLYYGEDDFEMRCPLVLPGRNKIVQSMIWTEHVNKSHAGPSTTLALLRKRFWILDGRRSVNNVISQCPGCRIFSSSRYEIPSAPLPADRVKDTAAFATTGVDLFGPLHIKNSQKVWVVLFTCAVYRCLHLEVTPTLSTEGFLLAFRRFVCRRGRPTKIYSDNGTNFVGCNNLFQQINWNKVQEYAIVQRMEWIFNPPTAAWWGGFWERLVGSCKQQLRRTLGRRNVTLEELSTILCDIEDCINRRPITYLSERDTVMPITPADFLRDNSNSCLPEADVIDSEVLRGAKKRCMKVRSELRSRFRLEYLGNLRHLEGMRNLEAEVGDVVLVGSDEKKRIDWPIGIIKELFTGRDSKKRTALVKTISGEYLRPVRNLYRLESDLSTSSTKIGQTNDLLPVENAEESKSVKTNCEGKLPAQYQISDVTPDTSSNYVTRFGRVVKPRSYA